jgi:tetratricopeptide (TPR) repeat protein
MRAARMPALVLPAVLAACTPVSDRGTLAELREVQPDTSEVRVEDGLDKALQSYRRYLDETPRTALTPEAMRRLADLKIEKQFGILGDGQLVEMEAREDVLPERIAPISPDTRPAAAGIAELSESQKEFERRASGETELKANATLLAMPAPGGAREVDTREPLEAIAIYDQLLAEYPNYEHNDAVLYQKSRAYDELGRTEEAMETMAQLIAAYPHSRAIDEVQFRRAEFFFTRRKFREAEGAYGAVIAEGERSEYYELALYKLGWALYKQEFYDEALDRYMALLDHKVSIGYDFDGANEEGDERRIADTFRVISLSFSNLGGTQIVNEYFTGKGQRSYEDRIYSNLGEFFVTKLRYQDAAAAYEAFVARYPFHRTSPQFGMRVVEIYTKGGFQQLVLESKKAFASTYRVEGEYWRHFAPGDRPEVLAYLKSNLRDLANHYHSQYQQASLAKEKPANYAEASRWYREFLASFPQDPASPPINYQLAGLLLEENNYGEAALEYERTAYDYLAHEKAAAAGYAAVFAHREHLKGVGEAVQAAVKQATVASSLRFAGTFPAHEQAPAVLGAAADDLYGMGEYEQALAAAQKLIDGYPGADLPIRRGARTVVAHSWFELAAFPEAENAYALVLEITPDGDAKRAALVDNLAAAIYKQGEQANAAKDWRAAAGHFLRIRDNAPTSGIRASAEYDAGAALIRLEDWTAAADVLEAFRSTFPEHELQREATKQIAFVYRQGGETARAAGEYERVAAESGSAELRGEALLVAGELHEQAKGPERALAVYQRYVEEFPRPLEAAVETRFKIAGIHAAMNDEARRREELARIVAIDAQAGAERTDRVRHLAARSALVLAEQSFGEFAAVKLTQPFEASLKDKQRRMDSVLGSLGLLVDYQVGEVTAAATFYMAEVYDNFNRSLLESERPGDLSAADLKAYELALEDEAFPFEEKAIEVHAKNLELIGSGIYNDWIDRSLGKLARLMPARYAKEELSSGFLGSIDYYAYRVPSAPVDIGAPGGGTQAAVSAGGRPGTAATVEVADAR